MSDSVPTSEELEQSITALERHLLGEAAAPALAALRSQLEAISEHSPGQKISANTSLFCSPM